MEGHTLALSFLAGGTKGNPSHLENPKVYEWRQTNRSGEAWLWYWMGMSRSLAGWGVPGEEDRVKLSDVLCDSFPTNHLMKRHALSSLGFNCGSALISWGTWDTSLHLSGSQCPPLWPRASGRASLPGCAARASWDKALRILSTSRCGKQSGSSSKR